MPRRGASHKRVDRCSHDIGSGVVRHVADVFEQKKSRAWQYSRESAGVGLRRDDCIAVAGNYHGRRAQVDVTRGLHSNEALEQRKVARV